MHTLRLSWASKMTEQARVLVTKPNDMSANPKTHIAERTDFHTLSFDLHKHALACEHLAPVYEDTENEYINVIKNNKMHCTKFSKTYKNKKKENKQEKFVLNVLHRV